MLAIKSLSKRVSLLGLCILMLAGCTPAAPAPLLDTTFAGFGIDGKVISTEISCCNIALQPDGKIVAAAGVRVVRHLANGALDTTFGNEGKATLLSPDGFYVAGTAVAIQADGKIVVAGWIDDIGSDLNFKADFFLARLTSTGAPDPTFGDGGIVRTSFNDGDTGGASDPSKAWSDFAYAVLIQPDGKIVACGEAWVVGDDDFAVARYHPDGSRDTTFGIGGKVTIGFGDDEACLGIAQQEDGKLVLVGGEEWYQSFPGDHDFEIVRLNPDGTLDDSFDGDGKRKTGFGNAQDIATTVAIQPDGKIVVAGCDCILSPSLGFVSNGHDALLSRYWASDGELDDSFDGDGKRSIDGLSGAIRDMVIQPDGKILLLGEHKSPNGDLKFAFYRLNPDSSLDTSFDDDGRAFIDIAGVDEGHALALQPDGRIIGSGHTSPGSMRVLIRLWPDGSFDTGGQQALGFAEAYMGIGTDEIAYAMAVQPDGRIILAGELENQTNTGSEMALARFLPDGQPDGSFGEQSRVLFGIGNYDSAHAVALQPDGKIVAVGSVEHLKPETANILVVRFNADGKLDTTFGFGGFNTLDFLNGYDTATAVAIAPDGKIVVGSTAFSPTGTHTAFVVARFHSDGMLDTSFNGDGMHIYETPDNTHWASAVVVQPDLKIVLAGGIGGDFALVRFNQDGSLDTTFGFGGKATTDMGGADRINALVLKPDGRFVAAGTRIIWPFGNDVVLAQYTMDGILESGGAGNPWGKAMISWSEMDQAYAVDWRSDGQIVVVGCADSQINMALLATNDPPAPIKFTTDFVGNNACAFAVKFTGPDKLLMAGFQEFNGDRNMALARFDVTADLGLLNLQQ